MHSGDLDKAESLLLETESKAKLKEALFHWLLESTYSTSGYKNKSVDPFKEKTRPALLFA